ncbi:MAG: hypothetical protein KBD52_01245 [Candidatus Pacebacteria bacterium]|nr:hypothetical protein [Candidatus Paceibacterota bacterium]
MPKESFDLNKKHERGGELTLNALKDQVLDLTNAINIENFVEDKPPLPSFLKGRTTHKKLLEDNFKEDEKNTREDKQ